MFRASIHRKKDILFTLPRPTFRKPTLLQFTMTSISVSILLAIFNIAKASLPVVPKAQSMQPGNDNSGLSMHVWEEVSPSQLNKLVKGFKPKTSADYYEKSENFQSSPSLQKGREIICKQLPAHCRRPSYRQSF